MSAPGAWTHNAMSAADRCPTCDGVTRKWVRGVGFTDCPDCDGTGLNEPTDCVMCGDTHPAAQVLSPGPLCPGCFEATWEECAHGDV